MELTSIYLIRDEPTGFYKIGHSYDPHRREKTLLAQAPGVVLVCYWENKRKAVEKWLHRHFREQRVRGEWFNLEEKHLVHLYFLPALNKYGRVDVIPPTSTLQSRVLIKKLKWSIMSQRNTRPAWMEPIYAETERVFGVTGSHRAD